MKLQMKFKKVLASVMVFSVAAASIAAPSGTVLSSLMPVSSITASAADYTSGYYKYTVSGKKATITGYTNTSASTITIPKTFKKGSETYSVEAIGNMAFKNTNVKKVTVNSNIKLIGYHAFSDCPNLEEVIINGNPTLCDGMFKNSSALKKVQLSNSITKIPSWFFYNCTSLTNITLPSSLTTMENSAFRECSSLSSVTIPSGCTEIWSSTFQDCTSLTSVTMDSVNYIRSDAFSGCTSLTSVELPAGIEISLRAFRNTGLESVSLQDGSVSRNAFSECQNLSEVSFSGNVKVESNAFDNCPNLFNINVPITSVNTTYNWANNAFNDCPNLMTINGKGIVQPFLQAPLFYNRNYDKFFKRYFNACRNTGCVTQYEDMYCDYIVETKITPDMSDLHKARVLHDWIINKVTYDSDEKHAQKNHITSSVFMNNSTVCEGYARGYARLMNAAGMETYYMKGTDSIDGVTHGWNLVNINGNYYHVDVCWDDSANGARYTYFLLTDDEIKQYGYHASWKVNALESDDLIEYTGGSTAAVNLLGDINCDGEINTLDFHKIENWLNGTTTMTNKQRGRADINLDGSITAADVAIMRDFYFTATADTFRQYLNRVVYPTIPPLPSYI